MFSRSCSHHAVARPRPLTTLSSNPSHWRLWHPHLPIAPSIPQSTNCSSDYYNTERIANGFLQSAVVSSLPLYLPHVANWISLIRGFPLCILENECLEDPLAWSGLFCYSYIHSLIHSFIHLFITAFSEMKPWRMETVIESLLGLKAVADATCYSCFLLSSH